MTDSNLGFEVQGSEVEHKDMVDRIVAVSEFIGFEFGVAERGSETKFKQAVELAARVAVAIFDHSDEARSVPVGSKVWSDSSPVGVISYLVEDGTFDAYNLSIENRRKNAAYEREFRSIFNSEPGSSYVYPKADIDSYAERLRAEKRRKIVDPEGSMTEQEYDETFTYITEEDGCDDEYRELDFDLYYDGEIIDQAERQIVLAKIAGWLKIASTNEAPKVVEVPDVNDPLATEKLRRIQQYLRPVNFPELVEEGVTEVVDKSKRIDRMEREIELRTGLHPLIPGDKPQDWWPE